MCVKNVKKHTIQMVIFLKYVAILIFFKGSYSLRLQVSLEQNFVFCILLYFVSYSDSEKREKKNWCVY